MEDLKEQNKTPIFVKVDKDGSLAFTNHIELRHCASILYKTSAAPKNLREAGIEAIASALLLCKQFNLPQKAIAQMAYVNGSLTCYGSLVTALAEKHPNYGEKKEFFVDSKCEVICLKNKNLFNPVFAAVVQIKRKDSSDFTEYFFSMDDAKKSGLLSSSTKATSPWLKYTKDMLMHKARARALRSEYASALEGIYYHEDYKESLVRDVSNNKNTDLDILELEIMKKIS